MPKSRIFNIAYMTLNAIHENKILSKISEFTVLYQQSLLTLSPLLWQLLQSADKLCKQFG